ncbi:MAG: CxxC-x17-CxxC domain-containing protein [Candidatus Paceibacterota bacterium]
MKDFKKFGDSRGGGRPSFGGKPSFNKFGGDRGGNKFGSDRPVVMHKATCAECGKTCEVPFRPNGEKPVFCNDCFGAKRDGQSGGFDRPQKRDFESSRPSFSRPEPRHEAPHAHVHAEPRPDRRIDELKQQVESLSAKMDSLMNMLNAAKPSAKVSTVEEKTSTPEPMKKASKPSAPKKVAAPKVAAKSTPVKKAAAKAPTKVAKPAAAKSSARQGKK